MRWANILRLSCAAVLVCNGISSPAGLALQRRQGTDTGVATLTSSNETPSSTPPPSPTPTSRPNEQSSGPATTPPPESGSSSLPEPSQDSATVSNSTSASTKPLTKSTSAHPPAATNGTAAHQHKEDPLPIQPRITPALSVGGVILILTGVTYNLVGVKNKWIHISLSTAYLTSLAITVLIDYVMNPPISNGIQGAYFVGIFLTGLLFGAGSLIFKEVTEGLGCLLGGFCLGMWFLTLKPGGLITSESGKGIFIAIFCAIVWSLSFSHHTRAYGLIGSTSFSGATAFVLGIDCFSRAGLKEFWFYIWALNEDLFPLGTTTYPMTRGIRVEIIAIILGTIVGVISQIKLWKIVSDKQKKKEEARQDEERRKDVVEQALGRQLERQNDKDRSNWEKQYGNTLQSKRSTILWSDAHPDQSYTHIPSLVKRSSSSDSLEMSSIAGKRQSKLKRQSSATVDVIPEEREDQDARMSMERQRALTALLDNDRIESADPPTDRTPPVDLPPEVVPLPFKIPVAPGSPVKETASDHKSGKTSSPSMFHEAKHTSKRRSLQSMLSLSPKLSTENLPPSESQEALVMSDPVHSRPSSVAATLDEENDRAELGGLAEGASDQPCTPKIVVFPAASFDNLQKKSAETENVQYDSRDAPPSPPALSVSFDFDPEELSRPATATLNQNDALSAEKNHKRLSKETKTSSLSDSGLKQSSDSYANSNVSTGQTTASEVLTKGALDQVPSQVSNVVLSYRTNEWAKHISTADAPVFDEPEPIEGVEDEAPTQLAPPSAVIPVSPSEQNLEGSRTLSASSKPPAPHVIASSSTGNVVANVQPPQRTLSDKSVTSAQKHGVASKAQPVRPSSSKGKRSSTGTGGMKPSLVSTPIDENTPTEFVAVERPHRNSISGPQRVLSSSSLAGTRPATAHSSQVYGTHRSNSYTSIADGTLRLSRTSSVMSNGQGWKSDTRLSSYDSSHAPSLSSVLINTPAMRSETRLASYESRQPQKRDNKSDAQRREQLLAEWRILQQQGATMHVLPKQSVDERMAQMVLDKEHKRLMEDQQRAMHQQKQFQIDQVMRRPDMQDLHKEAMRKMQANAAKKL